jgi:flavin-dependent thymidylate synthase
MQIYLAGFNIDIENIDAINSLVEKYPNITQEDIDEIKAMHWTPETISASYARISRDPRPINELREEARHEIDKARKSNKMIIFNLGHSSIAEHAAFNFDIINISRLACEDLERSRLASFTEKSQRYIKLDEDYYIPSELDADPKLKEKYTSTARALFAGYEELHNKLKPWFLQDADDLDPNSRDYKTLENLAKEDARYVLPLSMYAQVGMTVNGRSLERMIRRLGSSLLPECHTAGSLISKTASDRAPSLIKYTKPTDFEVETYPALAELFKSGVNNDQSQPDVRLIAMDKELEINILAAMAVKTGHVDYISAKKMIHEMPESERLAIFKESVRHINFYDPVLREFEASSLEFSVQLSASAYAQLKRHRMATIIDGRYDPRLGVTVPPSISETGQEKRFMELMALSEELYADCRSLPGDQAVYALTNAHRKHVYIRCNFREMVHISRLRADMHAQWDIRLLSEKMMDLVKKEHPLFGLILGGKDSFEGNKEAILNMDLSAGK